MTQPCGEPLRSRLSMCRAPWMPAPARLVRDRRVAHRVPCCLFGIDHAQHLMLVDPGPISAGKPWAKLMHRTATISSNGLRALNPHCARETQPDLAELMPDSELIIAVHTDLKPAAGRKRLSSARVHGMGDRTPPRRLIPAKLTSGSST